jgi:hypothetical protein
LERIQKLFTKYRPDVLVLQQTSGGTARLQRIDHLNATIAKLAPQYGFQVQFFSRTQVREHFGYLGSTTKDAIAASIAKHIPAFERFLPAPRKPWKSEDRRMGIFDAAALALTFFANWNEPPNEVRSDPSPN